MAGLSLEFQPREAVAARGGEADARKSKVDK
jgi:hypothetical protein